MQEMPIETALCPIFLLFLNLDLKATDWLKGMSVCLDNKHIVGR